jgi:hypothetical protein
VRLQICIVLVVCLLGTRSTGYAEDEQIWKRHGIVHWAHASVVPSAEDELLELAMSGRLAKWSEDWIAKSIAAAPPIEDLLWKARQEEKLLFWYVPSVAGQHMILPHLLDRYLMLGPLSDPEVAGVLNTRFVTLKLPAGGALAKRFGLEAPGFIEPGFLILSPEGQVLHRMNRVNTFESSWFLHTLQAVLRSQPDPVSKKLAAFLKAEAERDGLAQAVEERRHAFFKGCLLLLDRGADQLALPVLERLWAKHVEVTAGGSGAAVKGPKWCAHVAYLLGLIHRRRRAGNDALLYLRFVESLERGGGGTPRNQDYFTPRAAVEIGLVQLRLGRLGEAQKSLERLLARATKGGRAQEARYLLGVARYVTGQDAKAREAWKLVTSDHTGWLWASKADACMRLGTDLRQGESALPRAFLDPRWMAPEVYRLAPDTQWRRTSKEKDDIRNRALAFLLAQQRQDGSFTGPRWGQGKAEPPDRNIEIAISALCCEALYRWQGEDDTVKAAVAKCERFLLGDPTIRRGDAIIWVYSDAFRLRYFAHRYGKQRSGQALREVRKQIRGWITDLETHQVQTKGSFKHYTYTSTFVTAAVVNCLQDAREAGFELHDHTLEWASQAILRARSEESGLFGYLLDRPASTRSLIGAAQRQPLCELALLRDGKADATRAEKALEIYLAAFDDSAAIARKTNFHVPALDSTAGYYFWHDFLFACECAARCTPERRKQYARQLLDLLCTLPEIDGSFVDSGFSYGKAYGTAAALVSLSLLEESLR